MAIERTFSIIKPDAVAKNVIGPITAKLEQAGLRILASKMVRLTEAQAKAFYAVHKERPFYNDLVKFMTEGPVIVQVLEGENAIAKNRQVMGATNPEKADAGTIRKEFATSLGTPAGTTRGFSVAEFQEIGALIVEVLDGLREANSDEGNAAVEAAVGAKVKALTARFPIYAN